MDTWKQYFNQLLNFNTDPNNIAVIGNDEDIGGREEGMIEPPTLEEVERCMERLKLNKAPGCDGISTEMLRAGGKEVTIAIFTIIKKIEKKKSCLRTGKRVLYAPFIKKGINWSVVIIEVYVYYQQHIKY